MESSYPVRLRLEHAASLSRPFLMCQVLCITKNPTAFRPSGSFCRKGTYATLLEADAEAYRRHPAAVARASRPRSAAERYLLHLYFSNPNTPTPLVVPTKTFPFAIIGVMYLFPK